MKPIIRYTLALTAMLALAAPVAAQSAEPEKETPKAEEKADVKIFKERPIAIQYLRAVDRRGINVFETTKDPGVEYTGFKLDWNAAFTSQVQSLTHANKANPVLVNGVNSNQLAD